MASTHEILKIKLSISKYLFDTWLFRILFVEVPVSYVPIIEQLAAKRGRDRLEYEPLLHNFSVETESDISVQ